MIAYTQGQVIKPEVTEVIEPLEEVLAYLNKRGDKFIVKDLENVSVIGNHTFQAEEETLIITCDEIILPRRKK